MYTGHAFSVIDYWRVGTPYKTTSCKRSEFVYYCYFGALNDISFRISSVCIFDHLPFDSLINFNLLFCLFAYLYILHFAPGLRPGHPAVRLRFSLASRYARGRYYGVSWGCELDVTAANRRNSVEIRSTYIKFAALRHFIKPAPGSGAPLRRYSTAY